MKLPPTCPAVPTLPELHDAHAAGLFHYFASFTGNEADAKDLLQELFIKLARQSCDRPATPRRTRSGGQQA